MTTLRFTVVALSLSYVFGCGPADTEKTAQAVREIKDHVKNFEAALDNDNPDGFVNMFTENAIVTRPDSSVYEGTTAIKEFAQMLYANTDVEIELQSDRTLVYPAGTKALDRGSYHLTRKPAEGGEPVYEDGYYRIFWHKQADGGWKIYKLNWTKESVESDEES